MKKQNKFNIVLLFALCASYYMLFPGTIAVKMYRIFMEAIQSHLADKIANYGLVLQVYNQYDQAARIVCFIIAAIGIIVCLTTAKKPFSQWLKKAVIFAIHIWLYMLLYISILCIFSWIGISLYYGLKLSALTPQENLNYWQTFLTFINPISLAKIGMQSLNRLLKAQDLFDSINYASFLSYCMSLFLDVASVLLFFTVLYQQLKNKKNVF